MARPGLVVFDLDYTLWRFWVDEDFTPPFKKTSNGKVCDAYERQMECFKDVPQILQKLHKEGYILGLASRTTAQKEAKDLVELFGWDKYFTYQEIYPGDKKTHFQRFHQLSGIPFSEMLFFDDESRNIHSVQSLGVTAILADDGMSLPLLEQGLKEFKKNTSTS